MIPISHWIVLTSNIIVLILYLIVPNMPKPPRKSITQTLQSFIWKILSFLRKISRDKFQTNPLL